MMEQIKVRELSYCIQGSWVLQRLSCDISPGECLWVRGANGVGKSTLLKLLAGLMVPEEGAEQVPLPCPLAYLGHQNGLKLDLSVLDNLILRGCLVSRETAGVVAQQVEQVLLELSLQHLQHRVVGRLSQGQQRLVALASLVMQRVFVWLWDEPFVGLDDKVTETMLEVIAKHLAQCGAVVVTSHEIVPWKKYGIPVQEVVLSRVVHHLKV